MPRSLSSALKQAMAAQETGEGAFLLLTISHPDPPAPFYLVRNPIAVVSRGITFNPFPIDVLLPDEDETQGPTAPLTVDNISREIIGWIRSITVKPTFTVELVRTSAPDVVEASISGLVAQEINYDAMTITTELNAGLDPQEPACAFSFSPARFPSLPWMSRTV